MVIVVLPSSLFINYNTAAQIEIYQVNSNSHFHFGWLLLNLPKLILISGLPFKLVSLGS